MALGSNKSTPQSNSAMEPVSLSTFPSMSQLKTVEQIRSFELLRLASFALKLRKLEQRYESGGDLPPENDFRCNLLRHAIFQQIITLTTLDAREQALQLIKVCRT